MVFYIFEIDFIPHCTLIIIIIYLALTVAICLQCEENFLT